MPSVTRQVRRLLIAFLPLTRPAGNENNAERLRLASLDSAADKEEYLAPAAVRRRGATKLLVMRPLKMKVKHLMAMRSAASATEMWHPPPSASSRPC